MLTFIFRRRVQREDAVTDPFAHPELAAMSLRELADLPFPRRCAEMAIATDPKAR